MQVAGKQQPPPPCWPGRGICLVLFKPRSFVAHPGQGGRCVPFRGAATAAGTDAHRLWDAAPPSRPSLTPADHPSWAAGRFSRACRRLPCCHDTDVSFCIAPNTSMGAGGKGVLSEPGEKFGVNFLEFSGTGRQIPVSLLSHILGSRLHSGNAFSSTDSVPQVVEPPPHPHLQSQDWKPRNPFFHH